MRLLLVLCAALPLAAQTEPLRNPRTTPADVEAGAKTFRSHCSACHGYNGEGGRGPNLATGQFYRGSSDAELLNNISNGVPGTEMPGLFYSPDRVWQVIAYIRSLNSSGAAPKGDKAQGRALFASKGCANCHRVSGEGGRMGPDLTVIGASRSVDHLRRAMLEPDSDITPGFLLVEAASTNGAKVTGFLRNEDTWTVQLLDTQQRLTTLDKSQLATYNVTRKSRMPSFKGRLSDAELDNLLTFLVSLKPAGGKQ